MRPSEKLWKWINWLSIIIITLALNLYVYYTAKAAVNNKDFTWDAFILIVCVVYDILMIVNIFVEKGDDIIKYKRAKIKQFNLWFDCLMSEEIRREENRNRLGLTIRTDNVFKKMGLVSKKCKKK